MPRLHFDQFGGTVPRLNAKKLPLTAAQTAANVDLTANRLDTINEPLDTVTLGAADRDSVYLWRRNSTTGWLQWSDDVDVVEGPVVNDTYDRIYYTGDSTGSGKPRVRAWDTTDQTKDIEIIAPTVTPTVAVVDEFGFGDIKFQIYNVTDDNMDISLTTVPEQNITEVVRNRNWTITYDVNLEEDAGDEYRVQTMVVTTPLGGGATNLWAQNCGYTPSAGNVILVEYTANGNVVALTQSLYWSTWDDSGTTKVRIQVAMQIDEKFLANPRETYLYYCYTFVTSWGEEGPPSPLSEIVIRRPGQHVDLSVLQTTDTATRGITHKNIYRTVAGGESDDFRYVTQITLATTTYVDTTADADTGETLETATGPNSSLTGLQVMAGGFLAAFKDNEVHFSEPNLPYAWPSKYVITFEYDVVGLAVSANDLVVMTTGTPYLITGTHPERLAKTQIMTNQSCVAKRGICQRGYAVLYPSPDGMVEVRGANTRIVTAPYYTKDEWSALTPASMIAQVYDERLHMFFTSYQVIIDLSTETQAVTTYAYSSGESMVQGLYTDIRTDTMYMIEGSKLYTWDGGATVKRLTWKSRQFQFPSPQSFACARLFADAYADPIAVTGTLTPDATGDFTYDGEHNDENSYVNGVYYLWWDDATKWYITTAKGTLGTRYWSRTDTDIEGDYANGGTATGTATVARQGVRLALYANGTEVVGVDVASNAIVRLPKVRRENVWALEVKANTGIDEFTVAASVAEMTGKR